MPHLRNLLLALMLSASSASALAERPKIGLALSGGGARGAAHIGVIRVLEEMRVPIDCIAGTSMGSIVGALYATGYTADELEQIVTGIDWGTVLKDDPERAERSFRRKRDDDIYLIKSKPGIGDDGELKFPTGLIQGQNVSLLFEKLTLPVTAIEDFDDLRIPYRAVATDIGTGEAVVLGSGSLAQAMRASMSVPGGFAAVEIDGKLLVDGGVANNLPISVVREMCADIVIAVDISTPLEEPEKVRSIFSITNQLIGFLTRRNTEQQIATLGERDLLIVPDLGDIGTGDFSRSGEAVPTGTVAADKVRGRLAALSLTRADYTAYLAGAPADASQQPLPVIDFIRIENASNLGEETLRRYVRNQGAVAIGQPPDLAAVDRELARLYGLELFETITYEIVEENGRTGMVFKVKERSWGPNYLQAGFASATDFNGESTFNFGFGYTRTLINELNGELRILGQIGEDPFLGAEIYQPLDWGQRWFVSPRVFAGSFNQNLYDDGNRVAEYRVRQYGVTLSGGLNLSDSARLQAGVFRSFAEVDLHTGDPQVFDDFDVDSGGVSVNFAIDSLDDINFPRRGELVSLTWRSSLEALGADEDFDQVLAAVGKPLTWGRDTVIPTVRFESTLDDDALLTDLFTAGGFLRLSGYQPDELSGQHFGLLTAVYLRRVNDFNLLPIYLGASLESGNVWQDSDDLFENMILAGSAFLGVDSPLGPIYLGLGVAEGGNNETLFLSIGKPLISRD
jgi:NTE family protein